MKNCQICNKEFDSINNLCKHLKQHAITPYYYFDVLVKKRGLQPLKFDLISRWHKVHLPDDQFDLTEKEYKSGFKYVTINEDGNRRKIQTHLYRMAKHLARPLEDNEIVYHLDGDISNNALENISFLPFTECESKSTKRGIKSRGKGKRGERNICSVMQEWWGSGEMRPTPSSGGWDDTGQFKMRGDIVSSDKVFPFSVEVKNREEWKLGALFTSNKSPIHKYWEQAADATIDTDLIPMITFTKNYHPTFVGLPYSLYESIGKQLYGFRYNKKMDVYITLIDEFVKYTKEDVLTSTLQLISKGERPWLVAEEGKANQKG